jgi:4-amino-4-deoxy-L-arabinose transferase-like glycosyltransferase
VAVLLAAAFLVQSRLATRIGITYDETTYLSLSQDIFRRHSFQSCVDAGVAPLPLLIEYGPAACRDEADRAGSWEGHPGDPALVDLARRTTALAVGVPLVLLVFYWLLRRGGLLPAALGGAFVAFSPGVLAHASLATTDACFTLTSLLCLAALAGYRERPSALRLLLLSLSFGMALASKYSAVFLLPVIAYVLLVHAALDSRGRWWVRALHAAGGALGRLTLLGGVAFLAGWAVFGWQLAPLGPSFVEEPGDLAWVRAVNERGSDCRVPALLAGMKTQRRQVRVGAKTYLCGEVSWTGFPAYFCVVAAVKSTPAEIALAGLAAGALLARLRTRPRTLLPAESPLLWAASGALLFALMSASKKQLGLRYILPLYPLLFLLTVDLLCATALRGRRAGALVLCGLLAGQVLSAVQVEPDYLAYFNGFAGGPAGGRRYLLDSNLDWGQALPRLKEYLDRTGRRRVVLAYFGTALPEAYGIEAVPWRRWPREGGDADRLALSLDLLGESVAMQTEWAGFADVQPAERVGWSLFLYDLTDPGVRRALEQAQRYGREK